MQTRYNLTIFLLLAALSVVARPDDQSPHVNSLGMRMVPVPAGTFLMGNTKKTDPAALGQLEVLTDGDYDEKPAHSVRISRSFYISDTEVTAEQFRQFRFDYQATPGLSGPAFATGVSWFEAVGILPLAKPPRTPRLPITNRSRMGIRGARGK